MSTQRIAVIADDGIGKEVMPEGVLVQGSRTPDMGGAASTTEIGAAIAALI